MKKILLVSLFSLCSVFFLNAQSLAIFTIEKTDGSQIDMPMGSEAEITFSNSELVVSNQDGTFNISFPEIKKAFFQRATGTNELKAENLEVFPNPAKEFIRINNLSGTHEVSIMTLQGQTIKKATVTNESYIDITDLNAGVYFLYTDDFLSKFIKL